MYYLPNQTPTSFYDKGMNAHMRTTRSKGFGWFYLVAPMLVIALVVGALGWMHNKPVLQPVEDTPEILGQSSISATPRPTASRSFGDLLKERPSYSGWLAGAENGSIILVQPDNGSINPITTVESEWYGPISDLVWSPDRTKLAYLSLPPDDAAKLSKDPKAFAKSAGFDNVPTPSTFPFGRITVVDVVTKEQFQSAVEVRNTPKSLVWLDSTSIAAVGQTLFKYSVEDHTVVTITAGGNTTASVQLQSPLAWNSESQTLYLTKVKEAEDGQASRLLVSVNLKTNDVKEMASLKTGPFAEVTASQGVDFALASDGKRVAVVSPQGLSYITLGDGAVHLLPYRDEHLWMQHSTLSDVSWLAPDKVAFGSLAADGSRVWGVWYIPTGDVATLGKGSLAGSWDEKGERIALLQADGKSVAIITPNWSDMAKAQRRDLQLAWNKVSW